MFVGVPKEIKPQEYRTGLTPGLILAVSLFRRPERVGNNASKNLAQIQNTKTR